MSQPSTADNTMTSEEHDQEIEDYIWNLMERSGLLSEMKSKIAHFVQNNGKTKEKFSVDVSRIHPAILSMIYEYLKWVGMKNTCALLLCESPVPFDTSLLNTSESNNGTAASPIPELCTYLSEKSGVGDRSRYSEAGGNGENNKLLLDGSAVNKSLNASGVAGGGATSQLSSSALNNQTFIVSSGTGSVPAGNLSGRDDENNDKTASPAQFGTTAQNQQQQQVSSTPGTQSAQAQSANFKSSFTGSLSSTGSHHVDNNLNPISGLSNASNPESATKFAQEEEARQYDKNISTAGSKALLSQKLENEIKPCNSDQSLSPKAKEYTNYIFMTEKQKMEALNKKFSGSDLFTKKKSSTDEPLLKSPPENDVSPSKEPENLNNISNPWKKPGAFEPSDFEDESISDLNDSTAEDVTQDLSMDSDSKVIAANIAECEHLMKLK